LIEGSGDAGSDGDTPPIPARGLIMSYEEYEDEPYVIIEKHSGGTGSFLLGIAIGAGMALLLAPQSGRKTRRDIERRARLAKQRAEGIAHDVGDRMNEQLSRARSEVEARLDSARTQIDFRRQQVQSAVQAGRVAARDAREELERRIADTKAAYQAGVSVGRERAEARELESGDSTDDVVPASASRSSRGTRRQSRGAGEASGA
jgi:gas vesicle protein